MKQCKVLITVVFALVVLGLSACTMNAPICATSNPVGSKVGEASGMGILGAFTFYGDASIKQAAKNGGITKISTVDFHVLNLYIYQGYTCIITGE